MYPEDRSGSRSCKGISTVIGIAIAGKCTCKRRRDWACQCQEESKSDNMECHVTISWSDKQPYANLDWALSDAQSRDYNFAPPTSPTRILILSKSTSTIHPPRPIPPTQSRCGTSTPRNGCPFRTMVSMRLSLNFHGLGFGGLGRAVEDGRTFVNLHE